MQLCWVRSPSCAEACSCFFEQSQTFRAKIRPFPYMKFENILQRHSLEPYKWCEIIKFMVGDFGWEHEGTKSGVGTVKGQKIECICYILAPKALLLTLQGPFQDSSSSGRGCIAPAAKNWRVQMNSLHPCCPRPWGRCKFQPLEISKALEGLRGIENEEGGYCHWFKHLSRRPFSLHLPLLSGERKENWKTFFTFRYIC